MSQERTPEDETIAPVDANPGLKAVIEKYENKPDQCTIYDPTTTGFDRMAAWITARDGDFVDLRTVR